MLRKYIVYGISILLIWVICMKCKAYVELDRMYERYQQEIEGFEASDWINFKQNSIFNYNDLSKAYQNAISKEEYNQIETIYDASNFFNNVLVNRMELPTRRHITGPTVGASINIDGIETCIAYDLYLGVEWFKPVILECNIYIYWEQK